MALTREVDVAPAGVRDPGGGATTRGSGAPASSRRRPSTTGPLLLLMAAGLLVHSFAGVLGRAGVDPSRVDLVFWGSLAVIVVPAGVRVCRRDVPGSERLALVTGIAVALQLSRTVLYPDQFVYHDEIAHAATLDHIRETGHLFSATPTLPVSAFYPGLEVVTSAVQDLTGLGARPSAVVVLVLARLVQTVALFALLGRLSGSSRVAGIASVVYLCNPQYLYFNSQFSYQTLALPLSILVLALVQRWLAARQAARDTGTGSRTAGAGLAVLTVVVLAGVVLTHHLTSMLLVGFLAAWAVVDLLLNRRQARQAPVVALAAVIGAVLVLAWLFRPGNPVADYLATIARSSVEQVSALAGGQSERHGLFQDAQGDAPPVWLRLAAVSSLLVTCLLLLLSLPAARTWLRRREPLAVFLVVFALMYPLIPGGHLTPATSEVFDRSSGFVYIGLSFTVAWWLVHGYRKAIVQRAANSALAVGTVLALLFVGGMSFGSGPRWNRLPGPYLVQADSRSVDAVNLAAARWAAEELPPGSRVLADRMNRLLMGSIGGQYPVTQLADEINPSSLLLSPRFGADDEEALRDDDLDYVVVDLRGSQTRPRVGVYWENGEWGQPHDIPVTLEALRKLADVPGVERIYDSGWVVVYDVSGWRDPAGAAGVSGD
ncbi:DUF6541 family protein [Blastococcus sp. URHD0036]|uniref:DUF6541 family protein n=1 Tax=Blastococcus sp. URHD0036 TaxID=1380356 RepID=UPI000497893B|nr:DUF6541 family protein [Blastococcus sp. URHD0036]